MALIKTPWSRGKLFFLFSLLFTFLIFSCEKESITDERKDFNDLELPDIAQLGNKKGKVDVCHITDNGDSHIININRNAWPDHESHGDAIDNDGDGLFDRENGCSIADCNDEDPLNLSGQYCGIVQGFVNGQVVGGNGYVISVAPGNCEITAYADYCLEPITWTLIETDGNVYTYLESDPCGFNGCKITLINNGSSVEVFVDCDEFNPDLELFGTLSGYEGEANFTLWFAVIDNDGDGYYNIDDSIYSSCQPQGYISPTEFFESGNYKYFDCNDGNEDINPEAIEECSDADDNDCNGTLQLPIGFVNGFFAGGATFGPQSEIINDAEWANVEPATGCFSLGDPTNYITTDLTGKIALIDRGLCYFDSKAKFAEENGAIAVVICNTDEEVFVMGPGGIVSEPTIPTLILGASACAEIRLNPGGLINLEVFCEEFLDLARTEKGINYDLSIQNIAKNKANLEKANESEFRPLKEVSSIKTFQQKESRTQKQNDKSSFTQLMQ